LAGTRELGAAMPLELQIEVVGQEREREGERRGLTDRHCRAECPSSTVPRDDHLLAAEREQGRKHPS
jgi:hypothetical protein